MRYVALLLVASLFLVACGDSADAADPERFCEILAELESLDRTGLSPDEIVEVVNEEDALLAEGLEVAPEEIKADAQVVADGVVASNELMLEAGGDFTQIPQADMDAVAGEYFTDEFETAAVNVATWRAASCS